MAVITPVVGSGRSSAVMMPRTNDPPDKPPPATQPPTIATIAKPPVAAVAVTIAAPIAAPATAPATMPTKPSPWETSSPRWAARNAVSSALT